MEILQGLYFWGAFFWSTGTCSHGLGCILHPPLKRGSWEPSLHASTFGKRGKVPNQGLNPGLDLKSPVRHPVKPPAWGSWRQQLLGRWVTLRQLKDPTGKLCWASLGQPESIILLPAKPWSLSHWEKTLGTAAGPHCPANPNLQAQTWNSPGSPWAPAKSKFSSAQAQQPSQPEPAQQQDPFLNIRKHLLQETGEWELFSRCHLSLPPLAQCYRGAAGGTLTFVGNVKIIEAFILFNIPHWLVSISLKASGFDLEPELSSTRCCGWYWAFKRERKLTK